MNGEDVELLNKGLDTLPNVNKVSVIGGPSHDLGTMSYLEHGPHATDVHGIGVQILLLVLQVPTSAKISSTRPSLILEPIAISLCL